MMQAQLFSQQLTFSSFIPIEPAPAVPAISQQATEQNNKQHQEIKVEIEEKQTQILELKKRLSNDDEAFLDAPDHVIAMKLGETDEVFDAPKPDEDVSNARYETEEEIRYIEFEIGELEDKLR